MKIKMLIMFEFGILLTVVGMFMTMGPDAAELIKMHRYGVLIMLMGWTVIAITAVLQYRKERR